jgi:hypothetical protein
LQQIPHLPALAVQELIRNKCVASNDSWMCFKSSDALFVDRSRVVIIAPVLHGLLFCQIAASGRTVFEGEVIVLAYMERLVLPLASDQAVVGAMESVDRQRLFTLETLPHRSQ